MRLRVRPRLLESREEDRVCVWVETLLLLRVMERGEEVQVGKGVGGQVGAGSEGCMDGCKIDGVSVIQYRSCARAVLASDWVDVIRGASFLGRTVRQGQVPCRMVQ